MLELLLEKLVSNYFPIFVMAGDYLLRVQSKVQSVAKEGESVFRSALTDGDLSVQNLFEVATLAQYPELAFDSEEESMSLNKKYFSKSKEEGNRLILDPVDGTKNFKDGGRNFGIVMTVVKGNWIVAVMMYLPAYEKFFYAIKGGKTYLATSTFFFEKEEVSTLSLPRAGVIRTDHASPEMVEKINKAIEVKEITRDYDSKTWRWSKYGILTGEIDGFVKMDAPLEDWGAIAFLAEHAGAIVSDAAGKPIPSYFDFPDRKIPSLVVSRDAIIHNVILNALAS